MSSTRTIVGLALIPGFVALGGPLDIQPAPQLCQIETSFDGHKSTPSGGAAYFGITVESQPIEITALDLNLSTDAGVPFQIEVYTTPDTWRGKELDPSQWTLRTTGAGMSAGRGQASSAPLVGALALDADTSFGLAIVVTGGGHWYHNGNGSNEFYSNSDLSITMGSMSFIAFSSTPFRPRVWNGTVHYTSATCACPCACDFDPDPACDIFDFLAFQTASVAGEPCACLVDPDPLCDIFDFLEFQNEFVGGCP